MRNVAFTKLQTLKSTHSKVKHILYDDFKHPQPYLTSNLLSHEEKNLLFNLRCKRVRGVKKKIPGMYKGNMLCPLCHSEEDTQEHLLYCIWLKNILPQANNTQVIYKHTFGDKREQKAAVALYSHLLSTRDSLLGEEEEPQSCLAGL